MIEVININKGLFFGILNLNEFSIEHKLTSKREIESKGKEFLIKSLLNDNADVCYDDKGKPHLVNDPRQISISHSHDKLAVIVNECEPTGIDIELIRDKVLKIKHKFLTESELLEANEDVEKLLIYWAAKETLYKIYGLKEVDFIKNLLVKPFSKHNLGTIIGCINMPEFKESFELNYQILENYVLVYALKKL